MMKRKDVLILLAISIVLTNIFAYLDYDGEGFNYLVEMWHLVLLTIVIFMLIPLLLLFLFRKSQHRLIIACIGFLPALYPIFYLL